MYHRYFVDRVPAWRRPNAVGITTLEYLFPFHKGYDTPSHPVLPGAVGRRLKYVEVEVMCKGKKGFIGIGLVERGEGLRRLLEESWEVFKELSGNIQGTFREHWRRPHRVLEESWEVFKEHSGNIQGTIREHSGNISLVERGKGLDRLLEESWEVSFQ
jgi:hypothetical protein